MWKWFSATFAALALCEAPAQAQSASLTGAWEFRAVNEDIGCTITGGAVLTAGEKPDVYEVAVTATQTCDGVSDPPVEQRCVATREQDVVSILCRVVRINAGRSYLPDDFLLVAQDRSTMIGRLTANWNSPAIWRRREGAPIA